MKRGVYLSPPCRPCSKQSSETVGLFCADIPEGLSLYMLAESHRLFDLLSVSVTPIRDTGIRPRVEHSAREPRAGLVRTRL